MITTTAPYWLDYLSRERTCCSVCYHEGRGWVKVTPPHVAGIQARLAAHRNQQRAMMRRHVARVHPTLKVRWVR